MNYPLISIVIPTYNRENLITSTLQSVFAQTYKNYEVVIIDDGSTDNTEKVVKNLLSDTVRYYYQNNAERGAARNAGIRQARGEYITFLDSDDLLLPNHLEKATEKIADDAKLPIFHLGYHVVYPNGKIIHKWKRLPSPINQKLKEGNFLSCLGVFIRADVIKSNLFNEDRELSGSEDYELWMRLASQYEIKCFAEVTSHLINHDLRSVVSMDIQKLIKRREKLWYYISTNPIITNYYGKDLDAIYAYHNIYFALHMAMAEEKKISVSYLTEAIRKDFPVVFNFRYWVVIKKLLLN